MLDRLSQLREKLDGTNPRKRRKRSGRGWRTASHTGNELPRLLERRLVKLIFRTSHHVLGLIDRGPHVAHHQLKAVDELEGCLKLERLGNG